MQVKKSTLYLGMILVIIILGGAFFLRGEDGVTGNVVSAGQVVQGETQRVVLSQSGYNYKDATVEAGKPISLSADSSVGGCLRSVAFNIDGKRYIKYLQTTEDTLQLPALAKGTYPFSCSMGMGYGKLIVE